MERNKNIKKMMAKIVLLAHNRTDWSLNEVLIRVASVLEGSDISDQELIERLEWLYNEHRKEPEEAQV